MEVTREQERARVTLGAPPAQPPSRPGSMRTWVQHWSGGMERPRQAVPRLTEPPTPTKRNDPRRKRDPPGGSSPSPTSHLSRGLRVICIPQQSGELRAKSTDLPPRETTNTPPPARDSPYPKARREIRRRWKIHPPSHPHDRGPREPGFSRGPEGRRGRNGQCPASPGLQTATAAPGPTERRPPLRQLLNLPRSPPQPGSASDVCPSAVRRVGGEVSGSDTQRTAPSGGAGTAQPKATREGKEKKEGRVSTLQTPAPVPYGGRERRVSISGPGEEGEGLQ